MIETKTQNFLELEKKYSELNKDYIIPNSQRDNFSIQTQRLSPFNLCKLTSSTMFLNWFGKKFKGKNEKLIQLEMMTDFQFQNILISFSGKNIKLQDWRPIFETIKYLIGESEIPVKCFFGNFRKNETRIKNSVKKGFPSILGLANTESGHITILYSILDNSNIVIIDPYGNPLKNYTEKNADYFEIDLENQKKWINNRCNAIWFEGGV